MSLMEVILVCVGVWYCVRLRAHAFDWKGGVA